VKRILLHVCCAPCASHCIEALRPDWDITLFFSNSNIHPREEYGRRLESARVLARRVSLPLVEDAYDHAAWREWVAGLEREPERGRRCARCFEFSLRRAAGRCRELGLDGFTTTLTVSPHKASPVVFGVGRALGPFLPVDFKKRDGFRRSMALSRAYGLYRQSYCGCEFRETASAGVAADARYDRT
jgi:predicted adenine nucleotide alpha hydrolase (AANH) superfamily ATPase